MLRIGCCAPRCESSHATRAGSARGGELAQNLGAVDRDVAKLDEAGLAAQGEHLDEQSPECREVTRAGKGTGKGAGTEEPDPLRGQAPAMRETASSITSSS